MLPAARPQTAPEITTAALDGSDDVAAEAVDIFLSIVGAEAGAMALRCLAKGACVGGRVGCISMLLCLSAADVLSLVALRARVAMVRGRARGTA